MSPPKHAPWLRRQWRAALAAALFLGALALRLRAAGLVAPADDAFITFRYAAKLAAGAGFVFNDGEPVLGTTTPLYTLLLAALGRLGADIPTAGMAVAVVASAACCALLFDTLLVATGSLLCAAAGAALLTFHERQAWIAASGMETALLCALMLGSYRLMAGRRLGAAALLAGMAAVTRPEGIAWMVLCLPLLARERGGRGLVLLLATAPLLAWATYATITFGSPVPQSVIAKQLLSNSMGTGEVAGSLLGSMGRTKYLVWVLAAAVLHAALRDRRLWLPLAFSGLFLLGYALERPMLFGWYVGPLDTCFCLAAGSALATIVAPPESLGLAQSRVLRMALTGLLLACFGLVLAGRVEGHRQLLASPGVPDMHLPIARWAQAHVQPGETLLVGDVGYVGYFNLDTHVVDAFGLVWRGLRPTVARGAQPMQELFEKAIPLARADVVLYPPMMVPLGGVPGYRIVPAPGIEAVVLRRIAPTAQAPGTPPA